MPKKGARKSGGARNVYLTKEQVVILSAIAKAMGETPVGVEPSRSQLIGKAVQNYIAQCQQDEHLKEAIRAAEEQLRLDETQRLRVRRGPAQKLKVVPLDS